MVEGQQIKGFQNSQTWKWNIMVTAKSRVQSIYSLSGMKEYVMGNKSLEEVVGG